MTMLNALGKFELARRLFDHAVVLPLDDPTLINSAPMSVAGLVKYAARLRNEYDAWMASSDFPIPPTIPTVDIATVQVRHMTCTGNTSIAADARGFHWQAFPFWNGEQPLPVRWDIERERDRMFDLLESATDTYLGDPGWALFLEVDDFPAVQIYRPLDLDPAVRIVARRRGHWALLRDRQDVDVLVAAGSEFGGSKQADAAPPLVFFDYEFTPAEPEWMARAPEALRATVRAARPDSTIHWDWGEVSPR